jgi:rubrerythrin
MKKDREKLLRYFQQMKGLEESARDYYLKVSRDPLLKDQETKDTFETISREEQGHADIMAKIISLINNNI